MKIEESSDFQIKKIREEYDKAPKILIEHLKSESQIEIPGKILEAQYRVGENFLVFVTEGNPFEEALYLYYFNKSLEVIDSLELSAMYTEGMLRNLSVINPDVIKFSFFGSQEEWTLKIFANPRFVSS
jgi:hypothetical protein